MNISKAKTVLAVAVFINMATAYGATDIDELNKKLNEYEQRIEALERRDAESRHTQSGAAAEYSRRKTTNNRFNPAISVIIDGVYASYRNDPEAYRIPGFALGGEAELAPEGFSLGHL